MAVPVKRLKAVINDRQVLADLRRPTGWFNISTV
jgi:hypothetical protein